MSLISDNVIPGNHGKVFETNATKSQDLNAIKNALTAISGIKDVLIDENSFPVKITVHTSAFVKIKEIEDSVIRTGFHAIPKSLFEL